MNHTRQSHLCSLLNAGYAFKKAVFMTATLYKVPAYIVEREFYR